MRKFLLIISLLVCILVAWDVYLAPHKLPYQTTLSGKDGKTLDARIIRASSNSITFIALGDGREYSVPVDQLSLLSRYKVLRLANKKPADGTDGGSRSNVALNATTSSYLANLEAMIAENNNKITTLEVERSQARLSQFGNTDKLTAKERSIMRQIERLMEENNRYYSRIIEINARGH